MFSRHQRVNIEIQLALASTSLMPPTVALKPLSLITTHPSKVIFLSEGLGLHLLALSLRFCCYSGYEMLSLTKTQACRN